MTGPREGANLTGSELRAMYEGPPGQSIRDIARATGLKVKTVHRRLQAAGTTFRQPGGQKEASRPPVPLSAATIAAMAAAYDAGEASLDDLGRQHDRSGDAIARALRQAGHSVRPRGRTLAAGPPAPGEDLQRLHREGLRPADIAAAIPGASPAKVARRLRKAGLPANRARPLPPAPELACAYAAAGTVRAVARQLHADEARIRAALTAAGVPAGSLRAVPAGLRPRVAELAAGGATPAELSAATGLPEAAVARLGHPDGRDEGLPGLNAA
jgi:hypothetical protein